MGNGAKKSKANTCIHIDISRAPNEARDVDQNNKSAKHKDTSASRGGDTSPTNADDTPGFPGAILPAAIWQTIGKSLGLTGRELEVIQHIFASHTEDRIAYLLGISKHTVRTHIKRIYAKLDVHDRCELLIKVFATYMSLG